MKNAEFGLFPQDIIDAYVAEQLAAEWADRKAERLAVTHGWAGPKRAVESNQGEKNAD